MFQFSNPRTEKLFTSKVQKDRDVHIPGIYSGKLSKISVAGAKHLVKNESNLLSLKSGIKQSELEDDAEPEVVNNTSDKNTEEQE